MFRALILSGLFFLSPIHADNLGPQGPVNLDFKKGELGKIPMGWHQPKFSAAAGYIVQLTEENPKSGKRAVLISRDAKDPTQGFGNLMQSFDAAAYRGKRVRFKAAVRADVSGSGNRAQLWLRVDRKDNTMGFFDNMDDHPIVQNEWRDYEIIGDVADDAESINLGMMLVGNGRAWLAAVSFEVIGKSGEGNEPARALQGQELDNLVAFTKLLGYVRYFHPSDEAAKTNWERFAMDSIPVVEKAKNAGELAQVLEKLFRPIAPTVRVFATNKVPSDFPKIVPPKDIPDAKLMAWRHFGVGTGGFMYSSVRVNLKKALPAILGMKVPDLKLPDPSKPFVADLAAGVSARIPLALYADEKGTLPRAAKSAKGSVLPRPAGFVPNGKDRTTRLAAVSLCWNVFQHFYPYFDVVKTDWAGELKQALTKAATDADERAFRDTLSRLVAGLHDGHGYVSGPGTEESSYLPLRWDWIEERLVVTVVSPKGAGGLKPGDVVVQINGRPAALVLAEQEKLISSATPQWKRYLALPRLCVGAKDSEVTLAILTPSGKTQTLRVHRSLDARSFRDLKESRPAKVEAIKPGILYVDLDRITDKEVRAALPQLEKAKGIIYDLRGYPGKVSMDPIAHLLEKPANSAQWQIPLAFFPDRKDVAFAFSSWQIQPKEPRFKAKTAFLTGGGAISQAETWLGIIEHYKLAAIVGSPTAGTNGNINPFSLPGGYRVIWTGMKVLKQDGARHHGVGIQPSVPVHRTIQGVAKGRDEVLERALQVISP